MAHFLLPFVFSLWLKRLEQTWILEENQVQILIDPVEELDKPAAQAQKAIFTLELKPPSWASAFPITILGKTKKSTCSSVGKVKGNNNPMSNKCSAGFY